MKILGLLSLVFATAVCQTYASSSFYTDNNMGQTVPMGRLSQHQKKNAQQDLLELMGLYSKPKSKVNKKMIQSASKFMRNLYDSLKDLDDEGPVEDSHIHINGRINATALGLDPEKVEGSDIIVSFVNYANKIKHLRRDKERTFYFDFSDVSLSEEVRGAELRIYKEVSDRQLRGRSFIINLYSIKHNGDWENFNPLVSEAVRNTSLQLQTRLRVDWDEEGWFTLDTTSVAVQWMLEPGSNLGLYLRVFDNYGYEHSPGDVGLVGRRGLADKQSFLVCYMDVAPQMLERRSRSLRVRRWTSEDGTSYSDNPYSDYARNGFVHYRSHNNCEKHSLYVNFRDIGIDDAFLIAPTGYSAFYCAGDCSFPLGVHMNATNHAIVQTLVHLMNPEDVPKPCCAPTKFGGITMLYLKNKSMIVQRFGNMIVRSCGCH